MGWGEINMCIDFHVNVDIPLIVIIIIMDISIDTNIAVDVATDIGIAVATDIPGDIDIAIGYSNLPIAYGIPIGCIGRMEPQSPDPSFGSQSNCDSSEQDSFSVCSNRS